MVRAEQSFPYHKFLRLLIVFHSLWNDPESFIYFFRDFFSQIFLGTTLLTKGRNKGLVVSLHSHNLHDEQGGKINIVTVLAPCNFIKTSFVAPKNSYFSTAIVKKDKTVPFFFYETFVFARKWGQIFKEHY